MTKRKQLKILMAQHDLKCQDVADLLKRELNTVREWCARTGNDIPDDQLTRLQEKLSGDAGNEV